LKTSNFPLGVNTLIYVRPIRTLYLLNVVVLLVAFRAWALSTKLVVKVIWLQGLDLQDTTEGKWRQSLKSYLTFCWRVLLYGEHWR